MSTATNSRAVEQSNKPSDASKAADFDFDRWAVEVRKQLMASLQKRVVR